MNHKKLLLASLSCAMLLRVMTKDALREALRPVPIERRLAVALAAASLKQQDVADKAGIGDAIFSRIVSGRRPSTPDERKAISKALGLAVVDLFGEEEVNA